MTSSKEEEVTKEIKHANLFSGLDKIIDKFFTQEEKDRLSMLCRKEISEVERTRYNHEMMITVNKQKPKLADDNKQLQRDQLIEQHVRVVEMFTKHIESLENIQKKLNNE
jgi:hypothetical protein